LGALDFKWCRGWKDFIKGKEARQKTKNNYLSERVKTTGSKAPDPALGWGRGRENYWGGGREIRSDGGEDHKGGAAKVSPSLFI